MIRHIVMWKLKEYRLETMLEIRRRLTGLIGVVPQIKGKFEVVFGEQDYTLAHEGYHLALIADFESLEDLEAYRINPNHKDVSNYVGTVREARACVDFEL